jgi:DNA replication protein DnaC
MTAEPVTEPQGSGPSGRRPEGAAQRAGFSSLGDAIREILRDHPKLDLIMEGYAESRRLVAAEGVDAARRRLLAPDETVELTCPRCKGAGWLRLDVAPGHQDFGRLVECRCGLVAKRKAEQLFGRSRIPAEYADLDLSTYPDRKIASDVADWWHERPGAWLLLVGDLGVGKTGLTIGLVKKALAEGRSTLFRPLVEVLSDIRTTYQTRDATAPAEAEMVGALKTVEVLALDDIGAERCTGWAQERLFEVLNHRYNERRATILTTNLGPAEMRDHLGERVVARIDGMAWVYEILGSNLRVRPS